MDAIRFVAAAPMAETTAEIFVVARLYTTGFVHAFSCPQNILPNHPIVFGFQDTYTQRADPLYMVPPEPPGQMP